MRSVPAFLLILGLTACHRGTENKDAVRQGVMDHLAEAGLNVAGMDVAVTSVQFNGKQADAAVSISAKGSRAAQGMPMKYRLEQRDSKWVVIAREDSSHGAAASPGTANPHGSGSLPDPGPGRNPAAAPDSGVDAASPHGEGKMPDPKDLPPATRK